MQRSLILDQRQHDSTKEPFEMTAKKSTGRGPRGPRGRRGLRGKEGKPGRASGSGTGSAHARLLMQLSQQMERVVRELQTQLTRIAQLQSQIDRLATGAPPGPERRRAPRTS
jgi:hypothetical protein